MVIVVLPYIVLAFAHVPETISHLTTNYEHWKQEAEEKVCFVCSDRHFK